MTGSYNNHFQIFNWRDAAADPVLLQADRSLFKPKARPPAPAFPPGAAGAQAAARVRREARKAKRDVFAEVEDAQFAKKILYSSWHPRENTIALAATNNLFLFHKND